MEILAQKAAGEFHLIVVAILTAKKLEELHFEVAEVENLLHPYYLRIPYNS